MANLVTRGLGRFGGLIAKGLGRPSGGGGPVVPPVPPSGDPKPCKQVLKWEEYAGGNPASVGGGTQGAVGSGLMGELGSNLSDQDVVSIWSFNGRGPSLVREFEVGEAGGWMNGAANSTGTFVGAWLDLDGDLWIHIPRGGGATLESHNTGLNGLSEVLNPMVSEDGLEFVFFSEGTYYGIEVATGNVNWTNTIPARWSTGIVGAPRNDRHVWENTSVDVWSLDTIFNDTLTVIVLYAVFEVTVEIPDLSGETIVGISCRSAYDYSLGFLTPGFATHSVEIEPDWLGGPVAALPDLGDPAGETFSSPEAAATADLGTTAPSAGTHTITITLTDLGTSLNVWSLHDLRLYIDVDNSAAGGGNYELRDGSNTLLHTVAIDALPSGFGEKWIGSAVDRTTRLRYTTELTGG
jgi:hypothetical protein